MIDPISQEAARALLEAPTLAGHGVDVLARSAGAWPPEAIVYKMEVLGNRSVRDEDARVALTGGIPAGSNRDGRPAFRGAFKRFRAVVGLIDFRAAISLASGGE